jgi:hypothetical protein
MKWNMILRSLSSQEALFLEKVVERGGLTSSQANKLGILRPPAVAFSLKKKLIPIRNIKSKSGEACYVLPVDELHKLEARLKGFE